MLLFSTPTHPLLPVIAAFPIFIIITMQLTLRSKNEIIIILTAIQDSKFGKALRSEGTGFFILASTTKGAA
jgi:hypothetical protein